MTERTSQPAQRPRSRQAFGLADDSPGLRPPNAGGGRELVARPLAEPRVDALTSELRQRIANAARMPIIGTLLATRR